MGKTWKTTEISDIEFRLLATALLGDGISARGYSLLMQILPREVANEIEPKVVVREGRYYIFPENR